MAATFRRVALAKVGTHSASTGKTSVTLSDLQDIVAASRDPQAGRTVIKIGHVDPRFNNPAYDGDPVYGQVVNLAVEDDTLFGDLVNVPRQLAEAMPSAYPGRSVEIGYNMRTRAGKVLRRVLTAVALLGATRPAIKDLGDVLTAHASEEPADFAGVVLMSALDTDDLPLPAATTADDGPRDEGDQMTTSIPAALLARLNLPEDADEDAVLAALDALQNPAPSGGVGATPAVSDPEPIPVGIAASEGHVLTAAEVATFSEMESRLAELQARDEARTAAENAARIDGVIRQFSEDPQQGGRITPVTEPLWRAQLGQNFEGTVALLAASPRLYSPQAVGSASAPESTDAAKSTRDRALATARELGLRTYEQAGA